MDLGVKRNGPLSNYPNQALTHEGEEVGGALPDAMSRYHRRASGVSSSRAASTQNVASNASTCVICCDVLNKAALTCAICQSEVDEGERVAALDGG
jgi:hypothetical protein